VISDSTILLDFYSGQIKRFECRFSEASCEIMDQTPVYFERNNKSTKKANEEPDGWQQ